MLALLTLVSFRSYLKHFFLRQTESKTPSQGEEVKARANVNDSVYCLGQFSNVLGHQFGRLHWEEMCQVERYIHTMRKFRRQIRVRGRQRQIIERLRQPATAAQ